MFYDYLPTALTIIFQKQLHFYTLKRYKMNADNVHNKTQELGHAAKEKMNDAGRAMKNAAEKAGDKAEELKDQAGQKMHDAKEAMKRH
ncbi:hypothetical protein OSTOST_20635 [Ostertagia ostertagi]